MGQVADVIVAPARIARNYAELMLKDVRADQFARLPSAGGKPVQTNHPAFVFGHLSIYPPRVAAMLGQQGMAVPNPPRFDELFVNGKPCLDDPNGTIYPPMDVITKHFFAGFDAAMGAVAKASDLDFTKPNPAEGRFKEMFPTVGGAINFMMSSHAMSHLGQVSAWRRFMGLGSAM
jgi:hypothetical protein